MIKKKFIIFFGSVAVCSKNVALVAISLIFFAFSNFHFSCKCNCCSFYFQGGLERFPKKTKNHFFFGISRCLLSCNITAVSCAVNNFHCSFKCHCCPLFHKSLLKKTFYIFFRLNSCLL